MLLFAPNGPGALRRRYARSDRTVCKLIIPASRSAWMIFLASAD